LKREGEKPGWFPVAAGGVLAAGGATVAGLLAGGGGALLAGLVGAGAGVALHHRALARSTRRQRALAVPFPDAFREILRDRYDHYDRLPPSLVPRFEDDLRIFLLEKRITGVEVVATDELRVLVAASAVTLSLGWPEFEWDALAEVLLYPQDFDRDYSYDNPELSGQTSGWGTVILSAPTLGHSFDDPDDGYHVGLHEFAHLLDMEAADFRGTPAGLDGPDAARWAALAEHEMERMRRGRSVLDDYGAEDVVEFFAVAVEGFFETPLALRKRHRELYELLSRWFRQDPAAWDDARGVRL
jgi:Mlc titration factor MtfA (ptsG expression regulator)